MATEKSGLMLADSALILRLEKQLNEGTPLDSGGPATYASVVRPALETIVQSNTHPTYGITVTGQLAVREIERLDKLIKQHAEDFENIADTRNDDESLVPDISYSEMVGELAKKGVDILNSLTPRRCDMWHHATGIETEAGEIMDAIKRICIYDQDSNDHRANIIEELGDLEFYMEGLRQAFGIDRQTTLAMNMAKLAKRYKNYQYSNEQARARNDKVADSKGSHITWDDIPAYVRKNPSFYVEKEGQSWQLWSKDWVLPADYLAQFIPHKKYRFIPMDGMLPVPVHAVALQVNGDMYAVCDAVNGLRPLLQQITEAT